MLSTIRRDRPPAHPNCRAVLIPRVQLRPWVWPPRWDGDRDGPMPEGRAKRWRETSMTSRQIVQELRPCR